MCHDCLICGRDCLISDLDCLTTERECLLSGLDCLICGLDCLIHSHLDELILDGRAVRAAHQNRRFA